MNNIINDIDEKSENQYKKIIEEYYKCKKNGMSYNEIKSIIIPLISEFYNFYKEHPTEIDNKKFSQEWIDICLETITDIPKEMQPKLEEVILNGNSEDAKNILDYIVYQTRKKLIGTFGEKYFIEEKMLYNRCSMSQEYINEICGKNNIINNPIDTDKQFGVSQYPHALNIIEINGEKYLVDCTYRQFCGLASSNLDAIGTGKLPKPGAFLLNNTEKHKIMLTNLLKDGWIKCTNENLKMYFDSFYLIAKNKDRKDYTMESLIPAKYYRKCINQSKGSMPIEMVDFLMEV